jgi:hypothetical protein
MSATAFTWYTLSGNVTALILLGVCLVLILAMIGMMLKDS